MEQQPEQQPAGSDPVGSNAGPDYSASATPNAGPDYSAPQYSAPVYPAPDQSAGYPETGYFGPGYSAPGYYGPGYAGAAYPGAAYPQSAYPQSGYPQSAYPQAAYFGPGSAAPGSAASGSAAPGYGAPGYFGPAGYPLPGYGEPTYPTGYGHPALGGPGQLGGSPASTRPRGRRRLVAASSIVAALAIGVGAYALGTSTSDSVSGLGTGVAGSSSTAGGSSSGSGSTGSGSSGSGAGGYGLGGGYGGYGGFGGSSGTGGTGTGGTGTTTSAGSATTAEQVGIVDINTVLKYQQAQAAGTGMILTSNGEILTNNHVIDGATSITVTVVSTGKTYTATVVGDDPTADVAVLQLSGASGLKTVSIGKSSAVTVGTSVVAVGNAGGAGGVPSAVAGTVEALNQSITASDDNGGDSEQLTGMIMSNAPIQAGDSGGPLYNSAGQVIGMDTAGNAASDETAATQAYSIPISTAVAVAAEIESGKASSTINIGYPAFLGIELLPNSDTTQISDVITGSAAEQAGLVGGDTITAIAGHAVTTNTQLQAALSAYKPGQTITISWTDVSGAAHSAKVTLMTGPAA